MAETLTARFGLLNWGASSDGPSRTEFNGNFSAIETLAAIDRQGVFGSRPSPGVQGTYYWDTTNEFLWRDNGGSWKIIGQKFQDGLASSSAIGVIPLTINAITGQTANLLEAQVNGSAKWSVSAAGSVTGNIFNGKSASFINDTAGNTVIFGKGAISQSANLLSLQDSNATSIFTVSVAGIITSPGFSTVGSGSTTGAVVNAAAPTNIGGHPSGKWTGIPSFEVRGNRGGATFNDLMLFKETGASASTGTKRLGILMKAGVSEDSGSAGRSAAIYLESTAASFNNPVLNIDVSDVLLWSMDVIGNNGSTTTYPVFNNGSYFRSTPTGTGAYRASNTWIGTQNSGNSMYLRAGSGSDGFYFYAGGTHSDTAGNNGGGSTYATILQTSTGAQFTVPRLAVSNTDDVTATSSTIPFQIGPSSGQNMAFDANEIMGRNNGVVSELNLQIDGGDVRIGSTNQSGSDHVYLRSRVYINDILISPGFNPPSSPQNFDIWIDMNVGNGLKYWNGSTWVKINP